MVIPFEAQQRILPEFVKSSDILVPFAVRDVDCAIGTFSDVIFGCETAHDALVLREVISDLKLRFEQLENKALKRADALCGVRES